jgi:hypothetical protein
MINIAIHTFSVLLINTARIQFKTLLYCDSENCILYEQTVIDSLSPERLYNILPQAGSRFGGKHSEETKQKLRLINIGHLVTNETRMKISSANKGKTLTPEQKERKRLSQIGKHNGKRTPEARLKMSLTHMGKRQPLSAETRAKISAAQKGKPRKPRTKEQQEKMSAALRGRPRTAQTKERISAALKNSWRNRRNNYLEMI